MNISELAEHVGRTGILSGRNPAFQIHVTVKDARIRFGHLDYLVEPRSGSGQTWVEADRVDLEDT